MDAGAFTLRATVQLSKEQLQRIETNKAAAQKIKAQKIENDSSKTEISKNKIAADKPIGEGLADSIEEREMIVHKSDRETEKLDKEQGRANDGYVKNAGGEANKAAANPGEEQGPDSTEVSQSAASGDKGDRDAHTEANRSITPEVHEFEVQSKTKLEASWSDGKEERVAAIGDKHEGEIHTREATNENHPKQRKDFDNENIGKVKPESQIKSSQEHRCEIENKSEDGESEKPDASPDESFMAAVGRRDADKAKRESRFGQEDSTCAEEQRPKKHKASNGNAAGFDDEEAEAWSQSEGEEVGYVSGPEFFSEDGEAQSANTNETPKKMRLNRKTHPSNAPAYPARKLLKLSEFRIRKFNVNKAKAMREKQGRNVRMKAIELMARQPPPGAFEDDEWVTDDPITHPHASHRIVTLHGDSDTIFCKSCGYWSARASLKLLAKQCQGLKEGSKSKLRLLECGVRPGPEAVIPSHLKKRHGRKGRRKSRW